MRAKHLLLFFAATLSPPVAAETSIDFNFGVAPSKTMLGGSYISGRNHFNVGLNGFWINPSRGYLVIPAVGYNRYLTDNGFYTSLNYSPFYRNEEMNALRYIGPGPNDYVIERWRVKGWESGVIFLGGGKSWQFMRWGIHVDAHGVTPADRDFAREWGYSIGVGGSYRFRLD